MLLRGMLSLTLLALLVGLAQSARADGASPGVAPAGKGAAAPDEPEPWLDEPDHGSEHWDPVAPANRGVFAFNDAVDVYAVAPVARGWRAVTPQPLRNAVSRFFVNLKFPLRLLGCLTQGRMADSAEEVGRFAVNTSIGIAGLFDPATRFGLELHNADLGQSLGRWGVGAGPYLVLPLLGATSGRDLINLPLDLVLPDLVPGLVIVNTVNTRAELMDEIRQAKEASLDYYSFVRDAYLQNRDALIRNPDLLRPDVAAPAATSP